MLVHHESEKGSDQNTGLKNWISWGIELLKASDEALGDLSRSKIEVRDVFIIVTPMLLPCK